jgi:Domain of unknown function (DUF397)
MIDFKCGSFCNFGDCVEVGAAPDGRVLVRDSNDAVLPKHRRYVSGE